MAHQLMRAGPGDAVDREGEAGVLERALVAGAHQTAHQPAHLVLAHLRLELGGAHGRVAQPTRGRHRPLRGRGVLKKRYLEFGGHSRRGYFVFSGRRYFLLNLSTRPAVSTSFCLPV